MNLTQPTNTQFEQAQLAMTNIMQDYSANIDTGKASVIRQLLIRPYAFLYAKVNQLFTSWLKETSVQYLSKSQLTENETADIVASNYFVQRKQGQYARGVITATCTATPVRIPQGSQFSVDGHIFETEKTVIASFSPLQDTENVDYVQMYQFGNTYKTNIPVVSREVGYIEIPQGMECSVMSYIANVSSVQLTSALTGGASSQTDAQMMQRCRTRCVSTAGTVGALRTKMESAPVTVYGCSAIGSSQPGCFRSRHNNLDIPVGGAVDVYVKTANQISSTILTFPQMQHDSKGFYIQVKSSQHPDIAGFLRISEVVAVNSADTVGTYQVTYNSEEETVQDTGARLSIYQCARIDFRDSLASSIPVQVTVQYASGINQLQEYMNSASGAFLGQDCLVKTAVPATVTVKGYIKSTQPVSQDTISQLQTFIAELICSKEVGDYTLNMDQIAQAVQKAYSDINLRLPYTIQVSLPMTNGGTYTFNTSDGTVNLEFRQELYTWDKAAYFFSATPGNIQLEVL